MPSTDSDRDLETKQLIEAILRTLANMEMPAMVIAPCDDLADSRSAFSNLCLADNAVDPKRRLN